MSKYTLMLREDGQTFTKFSPAEMQAIIARYGAWRDELQRNGKFAGGHKLRDGQGRTMRRNGTKIVVTIAPSRAGGTTGLLLKVTDEKGEELLSGGPNAGGPA